MALKITQVKGLVGTKPNHRKNIEALGLKRIGQSVVKQDTPIVRGICLLYTSPSPRDATLSRMPSSA